MFGQCSECPELLSLSVEDMSLMVTWYQWERVVQKTTGKRERCIGSASREAAILFRCVYINRQQTKYFNSKLEDLQGDQQQWQLKLKNYTSQHKDETTYQCSLYALANTSDR